MSLLERPPTTRPWAYRDYRLLVGGASISAFGNAIAPVALAFAVLDLGGSATDLGLVVAAYTGAEVVTVLFGGVLGDRLPRAVIMQGSSLAAGLSQGAVAVALLGGWASMWLLGVLSVLNGCLAALAGPSSNAMTRQTVPADTLAKAVTQRRLVQNAAMVSGFAAAGMLVAALGSSWAIAVDALTFVVAAACFQRLRVTTVADRPASRSMLADLVEGGREVLRHTWLWMLILYALLYHLFYGGVQGVLGPIVVGPTWGEAAWGWALASLMGGFLVGGLVSLRWRPRHGLFYGTMLVGLTACFPAAIAIGGGAGGGPAFLGVLLLGAFTHGLALELFSVNWDLSIQQHITPDKLARVYSFDHLGSFVARPLGLALTGPLSAATGVASWLWICVVVMAGGSLAAAALPSVRALKRLDD